jgi:c-di-GMP-binding flagellar brake protein YcgR
LKAAVRHITAQETRAGVTQFRLGLQFSNLPRAEENRLQRYIAHLELERHELS